MASLDELPFRYRAFLRAYPWRRVDPVPWAPLAKPLSECRLALVSSAGLVLPDQEPFDERIRGGDTSYPGMVWHDGLLWLSYYSSHEGKTAIYLARVKLPAK